MPLSAIEQVRLNIGDLGTPPFLSDERVQHFLDQAGGDVDTASGKAAVALAFYFATKADQTTGRMSVQYSNRANAYRQMAIDFGVDGVDLAPPDVGGLSKAENAAVRRDPDLVQSVFTRNLHDNPSGETSRGGDDLDS